MPLLRIVKEYRRNSKLAGIVESDTVEISREDAPQFIAAVNANPKQEYTIIDHEWALIGGANEILENPTGGWIGRMKGGKADPK